MSTRLLDPDTREHVDLDAEHLLAAGIRPSPLARLVLAAHRRERADLAARALEP